MHVATSKDRQTITIDVERYTLDIIKRFGFDTLKKMNFSLEPSLRLSSDQCPTTQEEKVAMHQYLFRNALKIKLKNC